MRIAASVSGIVSKSTPVMEEEANWLSAALLISEEAAVEIAKLGLSIHDAAERYGVSKKMIDFRLESPVQENELLLLTCSSPNQPLR